MSRNFDEQLGRQLHLFVPRFSSSLSDLLYDLYPTPKFGIPRRIVRSLSTMETTIFYQRDLSLLLAIVYFCNSSILILGRFFPHSPFIVISILLITFLCRLAFFRLGLGELFDSHYWPAFFVTSAYLFTADNITNQRAHMLLIAGLVFLAVFGITAGILSCRRSTQDQLEGHRAPIVAPLLVQISFVFIGNGVAMIGKGQIPEDSLGWTIVGGTVMLCISLLFFYCFVKSSIKIKAEIHPHTE